MSNEQVDEFVMVVEMMIFDTGESKTAVNVRSTTTENDEVCGGRW